MPDSLQAIIQVPKFLLLISQLPFKSDVPKQVQMLSLISKRKIEKMHIITLVLITVLGGATLILQDPFFIKWKPTAVNWMFALAFLGSQFIGSKPFVKRMMAHAVELSNVDVGQNLIELILASTQYRGGARVITAVQQLLDELLALRR